MLARSVLQYANHEGHRKEEQLIFHDQRPHSAGVSVGYGFCLSQDERHNPAHFPWRISALCAANYLRATRSARKEKQAPQNTLNQLIAHDLLGA
jgi:hypothetical protein